MLQLDVHDNNSGAVYFVNTLLTLLGVALGCGMAAYILCRSTGDAQGEAIESMSSVLGRCRMTRPAALKPWTFGLMGEATICDLLTCPTARPLD